MALPARPLLVSTPVSAYVVAAVLLSTLGPWDTSTSPSGSLNRALGPLLYALC